MNTCTLERTTVATNKYMHVDRGTRLAGHTNSNTINVRNNNTT